MICMQIFQNIGKNVSLYQEFNLQRICRQIHQNIGKYYIIFQLCSMTFQQE